MTRCRVIACGAICAALCSGMARADDIRLDPAMVAACQATACVGDAARVCIEAEGGSATMTDELCHDAELTAWEARLKDVLTSLRAINASADADHAAMGWDPQVSDSFADAHKAWLTHRAARCAYVEAEWGRGSGRAGAWVGCMLQETANQVLWLEGRVGG